MWLTGFDVPFLDSMYIDKPVKRHNLIQTISRVNRKYQQKEKGLIIDYIGIKKQMNLALAQYAQADTANFEEIRQAIVVIKDHLDQLYCRAMVKKRHIFKRRWTVSRRSTILSHGNEKN